MSSKPGHHPTDLLPPTFHILDWMYRLPRCLGWCWALRGACGKLQTVTKPRNEGLDVSSSAVTPWVQVLTCSTCEVISLCFPCSDGEGMRSLLWARGQELASGQLASEERNIEPLGRYGRPHSSV